MSPSKFYLACRNNEINTVISLLQSLSLEEINQIEPNGSTALHAAAFYGHEQIVKLLLKKGANYTIKNIYNRTAYDEAKTDDIERLFNSAKSTTEKGLNQIDIEWIFIKSDPSNYAAFNRRSLWPCKNEEDFKRLCREIRQHYIGENGPLADALGIQEIRQFFDKAIMKNDPKEILRAYTVESDFYRRLNKDLAQLPTQWSGNKYERNMVSITLFHPELRAYKFIGETLRGLNMSSNHLKLYTVGCTIMNKTFQSTSKKREKALDFINFYDKTTDKVICKYTTKRDDTALDIERLSVIPGEKEVLILPYATFKVKHMQQLTERGCRITEITLEEQIKDGTSFFSQSSDDDSSNDEEHFDFKSNFDDFGLKMFDHPNANIQKQYHKIVTKNHKMIIQKGHGDKNNMETFMAENQQKFHIQK